MAATNLPKLSEEIKRQYVQLIGDIESAMAQVISALPDGLLKCQPGCPDCCVNFSVFALEAAFVAEHVKFDAAFASGKTEGTCCPFLCENKCPIYNCRPILCRTQGLPIGYFDDDSGMVEVSACPVNFPDDFQFSEETVLFMNEFNARLATLNQMYCQQAGRDPQQRIPLYQLIETEP